MYVRLLSWDEGFEVIDTVKLIRESAGMDLISAKQLCESLVQGERPAFAVDSEHAADSLVRSLAALHVVAQVERE